jgi:D-glycero-D-manno-heptose 1,7-bisphosphate phosphatase
MIGDRYKDILFAENLNIKSGFVLTGYGRGEYTFNKDDWEYKPDFIGENLLDVARQIELHIRENN